MVKRHLKGDLLWAISISDTFSASANVWDQELNSPVVEWLNKGLTVDSHLGQFFGVRKCLEGESNSPAAERLNKGVTALSPTRGRDAWAYLNLNARILRCVYFVYRGLT